MNSSSSSSILLIILSFLTLVVSVVITILIFRHINSNSNNNNNPPLLFLQESKGTKDAEEYRSLISEIYLCYDNEIKNSSDDITIKPKITSLVTTLHDYMKRIDIIDFSQLCKKDRKLYIQKARALLDEIESLIADNKEEDIL